MNTIDPGILAKLDREALGDGAAPASPASDLRHGGYWLAPDPELRLAVKVSLITGRPLLLSGPSGTGKSSLARAISETLGWTYYQTVVTSQTRLDELIGSVDLVRRLHTAELAGRVEGMTFPTGLDAFLEPGVLWWAFDPASAAVEGRPAGSPRPDPGVPARQASADASAVVLIDEIDKAEPDVPNNLLVPLGSLELPVDGRAAPVVPRRPRPPLICITSNQEREMPPAFLRRCVQVELGFLPPDALVRIAGHHVPEAPSPLVAELRQRLFGGDDHNPGVSTAEFIDAVRAAHGLGLDADAAPEVWERFQRVITAGRPGAGSQPGARRP